MILMYWLIIQLLEDMVNPEKNQIVELMIKILNKYLFQMTYLNLVKYKLKLKILKLISMMKKECQYNLLEKRNIIPFDYYKEIITFLKLWKQLKINLRQLDKLNIYNQ